MRLIITTAAAAFAAAAIASAQTQATQQNPQSRPGPVSVRGCLAAGQGTNQFTLAVPQDASHNAVGTAGTSRSSSAAPDVKTVTYMLTPTSGVDLKPLVGHTVEVSGVESTPLGEKTESTKTPSTTAPGDVPGGAKAKVQTSAKADIVVREMNVSSARSVADTCTMQK